MYDTDAALRMSQVRYSNNQYSQTSNHSALNDIPEESSVSSTMMLSLLLAAVLLMAVGAYKLNKYLKLFTWCTCWTKLNGKVVVVTGANTGIGFETAKEMARRGARVVLACRDPAKGALARERIVRATGNEDVEYKHLDLESLDSIEDFANDILRNESKVNILINNAGVGRLDNSLTVDNLPVEAQVNHFGPFLLTMLLLQLMRISSPSRIINVTSVMHRLGKFDPEKFALPAANLFEHMCVYANTKLANVLFTKRLSREVRRSGISVNCVHPGAVATDLFRHQNGFVRCLLKHLFITPKEGAQALIHLAVSPELITTSGKYFCNGLETSPSKTARDPQLADQLWDLSMRVVSTERRRRRRRPE